eukprot:363724-Chlamydomonas_euryale.AAC.6
MHCGHGAKASGVLLHGMGDRRHSMHGGHVAQAGLGLHAVVDCPHVMHDGHDAKVFFGCMGWATADTVCMAGT